MKTSQRLFLAVAPAVLGVLTVAALAYWGRYARAAPHILVGIAAVAAIGSLLMAWRNTRYVAQRIAQLAAKVEMRPGLDELDSIETVVDRHASALAAAESARTEAQRAADARVREHGELLAQLAASLGKGLADIALPLHILLENRFGDLNENQEEMLETARAAAEGASADVRRTAEIAELDAGTLTLRRDRIHLGDVLQALRPTIESDAVRAGVRVELEIAPALPPVAADRARLQEALAYLIGECVRGTPAGGQVKISAQPNGPAISISVEGGRTAGAGITSALARRLIETQGGSAACNLNGILITLPIARIPGVA